LQQSINFQKRSLRRLSPPAVLAYEFVPVRWTQETYCDGADKWERCLRGEEAAGFDFGEAFFQGEKLVNFPPLSGVTEISQVETLVAGVLKAGELRLKEG
jgi:hypothetical protein